MYRIKKLKRQKNMSKAFVLAEERGVYFCVICKSPVVNIERRSGCWWPICENGEILTIEHIIPRAKNGLNSRGNFTVSCSKCNSDKADDMHVPDSCVRLNLCGLMGYVDRPECFSPKYRKEYVKMFGSMHGQGTNLTDVREVILRKIGRRKHLLAASKTLRELCNGVVSVRIAYPSKEYKKTLETRE